MQGPRVGATSELSQLYLLIRSTPSVSFRKFFALLVPFFHLKQEWIVSHGWGNNDKHLPTLLINHSQDCAWLCFNGGNGSNWKLTFLPLHNYWCKRVLTSAYSFWSSSFLPKSILSPTPSKLYRILKKSYESRGSSKLRNLKAASIVLSNKDLLPVTTWFSLFKFMVAVYVTPFQENLLENNIVKLPAP